VVYDKSERRTERKSAEAVAREAIMRAMTESCCDGAPQGSSCAPALWQALAEGERLRA